MATGTFTLPGSAGDPDSIAGKSILAIRAAHPEETSSHGNDGPGFQATFVKFVELHLAPIYGAYLVGLVDKAAFDASRLVLSGAQLDFNAEGTLVKDAQQVERDQAVTDLATITP